MANHADDFEDYSLDNEGPGDGVSDDDHVEDMELLEDDTPDLPSHSGIVVPTVRSAEDEQLLSELDKAQRRSKGVGALILTVLISGVLFVAAGTARWSWELALTFVPILLVHELGHFVAMKSFRYRNVNMFFIPFLGAAVTGQKFNVPAWKKAVVALMGPVPSIFLAFGIGIGAILLQLDWLVYGCIVALLLNGLNLVPLLPFDGGQVLHSVLFCRHYYLDVALRVITIVTVFAVSALLGGSFFLIGLGVFLLLTIPVTIRNGQVASQLRAEENFELVIEDDRVAPAAALRIAHALRARIKAKIANRALAQFVLQVVEQIGTKPPGVLASVGLLFIHGSSVVIALLAGVGLGIAVDEERMEEFLVMLEPVPLYEYECDVVEVYGDQYMPTHSTKSVIATFTNSSEANAAYVAAKAFMSSQDHLQKFGQSVTIALDSSAPPKMLQSWIDRWEAEAVELLVQSPYPKAYFSLDATFSDAALAMRVENELRAYLDNPYLYSLDPPWLPGAHVLDPAENEQYRRRKTCVEVMDIVREAIDKDERTIPAKRIGDYEEIQRLNDEIKRDAIAKFKASNPNIDSVTVDLYLKSVTGEYDRESRRQLTERLGGTFVDYEDAEDSNDSADDPEVEEENDNASDEALKTDDSDTEEYLYELNEDFERYGGTGTLVRDLSDLSLRAVSLNVTAEGAKAIADWLCALGAHDIEYAFYIYDE